MARFEHTCQCGQYFRTVALEGEILKCPNCGKSITVALEKKDPLKEKEFDKLVDATCQVMGEGGFTPSGAR